MRAAWMRASSDLRKGWRGAAALVILFGLAGGVVLSTAAGARRSPTAYERLLTSSKAFDVEIQAIEDDGDALLDRIVTLPQVADHGRLGFVPATTASPAGTPARFQWDVTAAALVDRNVGRTLEIPRLLEGRSPDPDEADEAAVSVEFLKTRGLRVGDTFSIQTVTFDELFQLFNGTNPTPTGPVATVRIVGVWRIPHDVSIREESGILFLTPAFVRTYGDRVALLASMFVRLRHGEADLAAFKRAVRAVDSGEPSLDIQDETQHTARVNRALDVQSSALWILSGAIAAAAVLILGQALGRWLTVAAEDREVLRAIGMGRGQRAAVAALPSVAVGVGASVVAVAAAIVGSRFALFGLARELEPAPGVFVDPLVLAIGAVSITSLIALRGWIQGSILARRRSDAGARLAPSPSVADRLARSGRSPAMSAGVRFAFEPGRGRRSVPVRAVLLGSILSIAVVSGAFTFGRSLDRLLDTPSAYGWNWDLVGFGGEDEAQTAEKERILGESAYVAAFSRVLTITTTLGNTDMEALAITSIKGSVSLRVLDGHLPRAADEVALATETLRREGLRVGGVARLPGTEAACAGTPRCTLPFRIVGRTIHWGEDSDPDEGALFTSAGIARVRGSNGFTDFLIRIPPGVDAVEAERAISRQIGDATRPQLPVALENVRTVRLLPSVLSAILAAICVATLMHGLILCVRRRGYDLAVLKTLGFVRRQVRSAVAWQATTMAAAAVLIAVPVGVVLGRWAWTALAQRLGVEALHAADPRWLALGATALLAAANIVALIPARTAARTRPALVLRTE